MPDRRGSRFLLEVLFLVVLAVALALAKLRALEIAGIMLLGWLVVALLEWAAWRGEPHYGSGLPPRYYVPSVNLPPAQPLEQVQVGYPRGHRDEEATWIAPAALRADVLGEWPHAAPRRATQTTRAEDDNEGPDELEVDPWTVVALPVEPASAPAPVAATEPEPLPVAVVQPESLPEPARSVQGTAHYHLDPLAGVPARRRFGRGEPKTAAIEVPARPEGIRPLPRRGSRQG